MGFKKRLKKEIDECTPEPSIKVDLPSERIQPRRKKALAAICSIAAVAVIASLSFGLGFGLRSYVFGETSSSSSEPIYGGPGINEPGIVFGIWKISEYETYYSDDFTFEGTSLEISERGGPDFETMPGAFKSVYAESNTTFYGRFLTGQAANLTSISVVDYSVFFMGTCRLDGEEFQIQIFFETERIKMNIYSDDCYAMGTFLLNGD